MTTTTLRSHDGARIVAETKGEGPITFVMVHGMTGNRQKTGVRLISDWLAQHGRVVYFDQRGHGESSGPCTMAFREPMDLDAAIAWARTLSDAPVVTIGFSLGAAVAVRHAALTCSPHGVTSRDAAIVVRERPDATVLVSGVGEWFYRGSHIMDRLFKLTATPWGRLALRFGQGITVSVREWGKDVNAAPDTLPTNPTASAALITHPLLVIHGDHDHYFPSEHGERVASSARNAGNESVEFWLERGMGHAERGTSEPLVERIAAWSATALAQRSS